MIVYNPSEQTPEMLRARIIGSTDVDVINFPKAIVMANESEFKSYGFFDKDKNLFIFDSYAREHEFCEWAMFNDAVERLITSYVTLGLISEDEANDLYDEDLHSLPMPAQAGHIYRTLMELVKDR